jgi:hypothetical protein
MANSGRHDFSGAFGRAFGEEEQETDHERHVTLHQRADAFYEAGEVGDVDDVQGAWESLATHPLVVQGGWSVGEFNAPRLRHLLRPSQGPDELEHSRGVLIVGAFRSIGMGDRGFTRTAVTVGRAFSDRSGRSLGCGATVLEGMDPIVSAAERDISEMDNEELLEEVRRLRIDMRIAGVRIRRLREGES